MMKDSLDKLRWLFPGKKFALLVLNVVLLFLVSLLDMLGVAVILPIIQLAMGADYSTGYLGVIADFLGNPNRETFIIIASIILVVSFILKGILSLTIKWWSSGFLARQEAATATAVLQSYMSEDYLSHKKRSASEIIRAVGQAVSQAYGQYVGGWLSVLGEVFSIIFLMVFLLVVMPIPALIAFVYFGATSFILQKLISERNRKAGAEGIDAAIQINFKTLEAINGFREIKLLGLSDRQVYDYQHARLMEAEAARAKRFLIDVPKYLLEIIFIVGIMLIMAFMTMTGGIQSASYLLVFAGACIRILPSYVRVVGSLGTLRSGHAAVNIVINEIQWANNQLSSFNLIENEPDIGVFAQINERYIPTTVKVENVDFSYPDGDHKVLKNLSLIIPAGSSLALVGGSGSGKTTLVDLMLGLTTPSSGQITQNGQPINENLNEWHAKIGYVPQDVFLGNGTVLEAVAFGLKPAEIDRGRVLECLQIAELADVIEGLDHGVDTPIGEHGTRLSGGQRQRLGIARALYRNPSVLFLDEATSALDNETEHKITQTINKLSKEITVVIVAHRLSTVKSVDQLIYLSEGEIAAQGTFVEVQRQNPEFAHLVELGDLSK